MTLATYDILGNKLCLGCNEFKNPKAYSCDRRNDNGLQSKCKSCNSQYYQSNKVSILSSRRIHYTGNVESIREYWKGWYLNGGRNRIYDNNAVRRSRDKGQFVERVERNRVFDRDLGMCQIQWDENCHRLLQTDNWHLDHIIPIFKGGLHSYENVQASCPPCNLRKHTS